MKKSLVLTALVMILSNVAFADCAVTKDVESAKVLDLTGSIAISGGTEVFSDSGVEMTADNQAMGELKEIIGDKVSMISKVFVMTGQGEIFTVTQDKTSCALKAFGTDGTEMNSYDVSEISATSLSFKKGDAIVKISKK